MTDDKKPKDKICPICGNLYDYSPKCHHNQNELIAFEQGKLAGKKELIDQMCKPMEEENALCDRRLGDCMPCEERKKRIEELKSQLKEDGSKEAYEQAKRDEAHRGDDE